jgi:hypothetical protein
MDDDPVLRELAEDLERDDPRLAALLGEPARARRHAGSWLLFALPLVTLGLLLLPARTALGLVAVLAIITSPLAVCWLVSNREGPVAGGP